MIKQLLLAASLMLLVACNNGNRVEGTQDVDSTAQEDMFSNRLMKSTADTIMKVNPELVMLLDTLYQHFDDNRHATKHPVEEDLPWINEYRKQLCAFFNAHELGGSNISEYAKVDTVLNVAERLYGLDTDDSPAGVSTRNWICAYFDSYRECNLFAQLLSLCNSNSTKKKLYQEWALYLQMEEKIAKVCVNATELDYWGGSIIGLICICKIRDIHAARIEMLETMIKMVRGYENGRSYHDASKTLLDSASKKIKDAMERTISAAKYEGSEDNLSDNFYETAREAETYISDLHALVKQWIAVLRNLDKEQTEGNLNHGIERAGSAMLIRWADIVRSYDNV